MEAKLDQLTVQSAPVLEFWNGLTWGKRAIIGIVSIAAGLLTLLALLDQVVLCIRELVVQSHDGVFADVHHVILSLNR